MLIESKEEMGAEGFAEETVEGGVARILLIFEIVEPRFGHPLNQLLLVVAELLLGPPLNAIDLSPGLASFLHRRVVLLVEAFAPGH